MAALGAGLLFFGPAVLETARDISDQLVCELAGVFHDFKIALCFAVFRTHLRAPLFGRICGDRAGPRPNVTHAAECGEPVAPVAAHRGKNRKAYPFKGTGLGEVILPEAPRATAG